MKKAFSKLSEKTPTGMHFVLVKPNDYLNGAILKDGNTVYVAADTLENGTWAGTLVHEGMHFAEGSREYNRLMKHLLKDSKVFAKALDSASGVSYSEKSESNRKPALEIQADSELAQRIAKSSKSKYTVIRDYLVEKFYGYTFTLSDGKQAIMDKRDAQELAHKADDAKSVELANLRLLIENAELYAEDHEVTHNKFDAFSYYEITVSIDNVEHNLLLNVGRSKYDGKYHIYDITKNKRTAHRSSTDVSRPVGYAIKSSSSTNSIPETESNVKSFAEKIMGGEDSEPIVVSIKENQELRKRIQSSNRKKYDVIREYLIEKLEGYRFRLSDGKVAIMDRSDAKELSHRANDARTAQLGNLRKLVEQAVLDHSEYNVDHRKFTAFHYYTITAEYEGELYPLWINVGVAKNDSQNHIYSITNHKTALSNHKEAPTDNGVSRPVGYAIQSASSTNSIPETESNVKSFAEKIMDGEDSEHSGELAAQMAEEVLGNEEFIGRLVNEDAPLAEKIMGKLRDLMSAFSRLNDPAARAEHKRLQKAEKLYLAAVENAGYDFIDGKIEKIKKALANDEEREDLTVEYQNAVDVGLLSFVDSVSMMENKNAISKRKYSLGKISQTHAQLIEDILSRELHLDIDISEYTVNIDGSAIKHINDKHGENGTSDRSMQNKEDLARVGWAANNAETGYIARTQSGKIDYDSQYKNKDGSPSPKVILEKDIGDSKFIVIECVPDTEAKKIHVISARKIKSDNGQVLNVESNDSPQPTSETLLDGIVANNSIPDSNEKVNRNGEKISYSLKQSARTEKINDLKRTAKGKDWDQTQISLGMSDNERYKRLNGRQLSLSAVADVQKLSAIQEKLGFFDQDVEFSKYGDRVRLFKKLGEEFSVFHGYRNNDITLDFSFSKENMRESVSKQRQNYVSFAKMLTCLNAVIDNAVGIEVHNRNGEGYKNDNSLKKVYVLASAFVDGADVIPVKLEVKEFLDKENTLHVAIALESIKQDGIVKQEVAKDGVARQDSPPSNISIADFFRKINPTDESFYKYIPKQFFSKKNEGVSYSLKQSARTEKINDLKRAAREQNDAHRLTNRALDLAQGIKDLKLGTYHNAAEFNDTRFRGSIERLSAIKYRGNLREAKTREIFKALYDWYDSDSPFFAEQAWRFQEEVRGMMKSIADGKGQLTVEDLRHLVKILEHLKHFVKTYNKVYLNGKYVDAEPMARDFVKIAQRAKRVNTGRISGIIRNSFMQSFLDPASIFRNADGYDEKGFYNTMFELFRRGELEAALTEMALMEKYEAFFAEHKHYEKRLYKDTVDYGDEKIPVGSAIALYMTAKRKQAQDGLVYAGFAMEIENEVKRFLPIGDPDAKYTEEEIEALCKNLTEMLYSQFSDEDKQLISIVEKTMNGKCAEYKRETDLLIMGYTNIDGETYYFPIFRNIIYQSIDTDSYMEEMDRVSNLSINKETVKGAKGELRILSVDRVFKHHVHQIAIYRHLAIPTDTFNRIFNLNTEKNRHQPMTVKTETAHLSAYEYFQKLKTNTEGIPSDPKYLKALHKAVGRMRGAYATYQLGLNPKTLITQLVSFVAAGNILSVQSIMRGLGVSAADVDKYCPLAKLRNYNNAAALSQGVLDKIGKVGAVTMKPIGMMDRFVVKRLFGACQVEVEINGGAMVGSTENKEAAGKLLERVILETQQNALATERSGLMRSGDEVFKSAAMFSADAMKMSSRLLDSFGEVSVLKKTLKESNLTEEEKEALQTRLKKAQKQAIRSTASMVASSVLLALLAWAFRWLYDRNRDEDGDGAVSLVDQLGEFFADVVGNMIGGLPILRDFYTYFTDGYEVENFLYSTSNDMLGAVRDSYELAAKAMQGKSVSRDEVARTVRKAIFAGGQVLGIPVRNVYNFSTGVIEKILPETGYYINNLFTASNYRTELLEAIEADNEQRINTITGLIMDEDMGALGKNARSAIRPLVAAGYKVLPRSVSDSITYDGEEIPLTRAQKKRFEEINAISFEVVEELVKLNTFKGATEEEQARALRFIWETYRALAIDDLLGTDSEEKKVLFAEAVPIEKLAMIVAAAENIKADVNASGKAIVGTRKKKLLAYIEGLQLTATEKYMVAGYLGFKNVNGKEQVKAYISKLSLSQKEKTDLLEYSGYDVKTA